MDVDALDVKERDDLRRKGLCFYCKSKGHMAKDCQKKKNQDQMGHRFMPATPSSYKKPGQYMPATPSSSKFPNYKGMNNEGKHRHLRAIYSELSAEDHKEIQDMWNDNTNNTEEDF
jgi:hypothetical protein